jgi:hypothetical protein
MPISKINGQTIIATDVTITDNQTTNATFYLAFLDSTSGTDNIKIDSTGLTYNALTNTLTLGASLGTLSGAATQVQTIATATNATFYPTFVDSNNVSAAAETVYTDAGISYNPSTNLLTTTVSNGGGYERNGTLATNVFNPTAATVYYGGGAATTAASTTAASRRVYIPKAGTITACYGFFNQTASASANTGRLDIRLNNTTDTLVAQVAHNVAASVYSNTALSIAVAAGDYIEFKWTAPATTAPTNVSADFTVYVS